MTVPRVVLPAFIDQRNDAPLLLSRPGDKVLPTPVGQGDGTDRLLQMHRLLADEIVRAASGNEPVVALLGDCCQTIAVMAGLERGGISPTLIWLDSHGDFNTWETTPSKFLGGMPLAMLSGRGEQTLITGLGLEPIADERIVLSDARDLDPGERELVKGSRIRHVSRLNDVVDNLPAQGPIYLHLDTDIIDASTAPAFRYPVTGGPTAEQVARAVAAVAATGRMVAASVCCGWDPAQDAGGRTLNAVKTATGPLLG